MARTLEETPRAQQLHAMSLLTSLGYSDPVSEDWTALLKPLRILTPHAIPAARFVAGIGRLQLGKLIDALEEQR